MRAITGNDVLDTLPIAVGPGLSHLDYGMPALPNSAQNLGFQGQHEHKVNNVVAEPLEGMESGSRGNRCMLRLKSWDRRAHERVRSVSFHFS